MGWVRPDTMHGPNPTKNTRLEFVSNGSFTVHGPRPISLNTGVMDLTDIKSSSIWVQLAQI